MEQIESMDVFTNNPIIAIKNVGRHEHKKNWTWMSRAPYHCFYYVVDGSWTIRTDRHQIVIQEGECLYLRAFEPAEISSTGRATQYFVSFYCREDFDLGIRTVIKNSGTLDLFSEIHDTFHSGAPLSKLKTGYLFLQLIHTLAQCSAPKPESNPIPEGIRKASAYVNINCEKDISMEDLCKITGYSAAHLRRLFVRYHGVPPMEYIIGVRIRRAQELLLEQPERTVEEIADVLGFCSPSYFCKLFRKKTGFTPLEYRKENRPIS